MAKIESTIQFEFGQICDLIRDKISDKATAEELIKEVRRHGNNAIRVTDNHLDYVHVSRNYMKEYPNVERVAKRAQGESKRGN